MSNPRPVPPPLPAGPVRLAYAAPARPTGKPGLFIAAGVASIVVGIISILASGYTASIWWGWYKGSVPPPVPVPVPLPFVAIPAYTGETTHPGGLPKPKRDAVVAATDFHGDAGVVEHKRMLDELLAETGSAIFNGSDSGELKPLKSDYDPREYIYPPIRFAAPGGVVELSSNLATFKPADGSKVIVSGDVVQRSHESTMLTAAAIDRAVQSLRSSVPGMTDAQTAFVADRLRNAPGYGFIELHDGTPHQIRPAIYYGTAPGNVLGVQIVNQQYSILPDGRGLGSPLSPPELNPATGAPVPPPSTFRPAFPGDPLLMRDLAVYCGVTVVVAVLLIATGIGTLVRPDRWFRLHWGFVGVKLVLIAAEVLLSLMFSTSLGKAGTNAVGQVDTAAGRVGLMMSVVGQLIYPVVLIAVLSATANLRREAKTSPV